MISGGGDTETAFNDTKSFAFQNLEEVALYQGKEYFMKEKQFLESHYTIGFLLTGSFMRNDNNL